MSETRERETDNTVIIGTEKSEDIEFDMQIDDPECLNRFVLQSY